MADGSLIQDDCMDDSDEGFEQGDCPVGSAEDDASLPPLLRLQKYAYSSNIFQRQMVVRMVQDFFRTVPADVLANELPEIMKIVSKIGDDPILRADLLEQIPHLAAQAVGSSNRVNALRNIVSEYLIPLVVRNLGYSDNAVDKAAHATLIHLIEQGYITRTQAEIQVCPSILALSKIASTPAVQTGAITLMSKLVHFLGKDVTERVFLKRFTELCSSGMFYVRKACAATFGEFCSVVGRDAFEKSLLPCYLTLCSDDVWGVRKVCAEVIMFLSCASSFKVRKDLLAPVLGKLLQDDCRWVRMAAFQSLGPFISTFADPTITNIGYTKGGDLVLIDGEGGEFKMKCSSSLNLFERFSMINYNDEDDFEKLCSQSFPDLNTPDHADKEETKERDNFGSLKIHEDTNVLDVKLCDNLDKKIDKELKFEMENLSLAIDNKIVNSSSKSESDSVIDLNAKSDREKPEITISINNECNNDDNKVNFNNSENTIEDDLHLFNSYNYWYISPDLPLDPSIIYDVEPKVEHGAGDVASNLVDLFATISLNDTFNGPTSTTSTISLEEENCSTSENNEQAPVVNTEPPQNIVPQFLIDHYISMTDPHLSLNIDNEMTYHCAYSLPAIALTLGSENWHLLKNTIDSLAGDMQYKVRRTVASSLHELAQILGPDLATSDLTPLFDGFIKDLDEVRIGVLEHLAHFLKLISIQKRNTYLPRLSDFLRTDNEWNWRFREELAQQMLEAVTLFKPSETAKYIGAVAIDLLCDKIAAVREIALSLVTKIVGYTSHALTASLLVKLAENFAHSKKWKRRQTFCLLCIELLKENVLAPEQFASEIMPHLLDLSWDPVANIRLVVARCLTRHILKNEYFSNPENENCEGLETVVKRLQADKDRDVRQSADIFYYISS